MYKVKLSIAKDNEGCNRQLPQDGFVWKGYHFYINTNVEDPDFWVVYSKGERKTETCMCSPNNTIFVTGEPETVYHYSHGFVKQFAKVLSVQEGISHKNMQMCQPAQPWHIGKITKQYEGRVRDAAEIKYTQNFDSLKDNHPDKTKLISVITSNKAFTKGHRERIEFVKRLKSHYGDKLDLFGWGFNDFEDKWDVIAPYKYHICLENSSFPHYWTEKLADSYLGEAFPLYYGCPNLDDYFPSEAYQAIDILDFKMSVKIIDDILANDMYEKAKDSILLSKKLVMEKYNLFDILVQQFETMDHNAQKQLLTIKHDMSFVDLKKVYVMFWNRMKNKISNKF